MKAVIYARYSSDNQREESIEGQLRECTAFAEKNGITILRHYIDRAFSAKTDNRPEFQNMIKDSGKKLFDMVIVWKLDRFARNRYDSARYKSLLKKNGVKVVSATEVISEGAEGIILESVLEGYAEYYSADLAEKVVRGMTDNALKCKFNGGTIPIGYVIDAEQHFQVDPITAPYVLEVFKRYDKGATMTELRDWLNEQGVKNTRGNPITYNSIQHMLCNRRYIGEFAFRDTVIPDGIPSIVPKDLFDRVQEKLEVNKKAPARHKAEDDYLLTTKIFCGYCGAYLCGESGTGRNGVHHYYKCVSVKKKRTECECKPVRKAWIEDLVLNSIMEMLADDRTIDAITSMVLAMQDQESVALPMYEQQLQEANTGINNLLNAIQQGILTKSTKGRLEELEAARDELENKIALEKLAKPRVSEEFVRFFLERFRNLDLSKLEHRKKLIEVFLNSVYVFNDKIVISCNYKDGTKTVNFSEMESALTWRASVSGSDLDCPGAPRQKKPTAFRFRRGGESSISVGSFFLSQIGPASLGSDFDSGSGSDLDCPGAPESGHPLGCAAKGVDRFCEALFRPYGTESTGNTLSIPGVFYLVWTKNCSRKTAAHRKKRDFCVGQGEKRRNTGYVFRAFSTKSGAKRSFLRLSHPLAAHPFGCPLSGGQPSAGEDPRRLIPAPFVAIPSRSSTPLAPAELFC